MFYTRVFYDAVFIIHLKHVLYLVQTKKSVRNFKFVLYSFTIYSCKRCLCINNRTCLNWMTMSIIKFNLVIWQTFNFKIKKALVIQKQIIV